MQRGHAAKPDHRHVHVAARHGREAREERCRLVAHVHEDADAVLEVELARLLGNVALGIVEPQERLQLFLPRLTNDLAVAVGVKAIDHHAVVAGELLHDTRRFLIQRRGGTRGTEARDAGGEDPRHPLGHRLRRPHFLDRDHRLELHRIALVPQAVHQHLVLPHLVAVLDGHRGGQARRLRALLLQPSDEAAERGIEAVDVLAERGRPPTAEDGLGIERGLQHVEPAGMQDQQGAMRLHRPRELDQLPGAVGQVGSTEGGIGDGVRHDDEDAP